MPSNIKYCNSSTSIVMHLLDMLPCKAKRYVLKWIGQYSAKTGSSMRVVMRDVDDNELFLCIKEEIDIPFRIPFRTPFRLVIFGKWPSSCWKKMLDAIAVYDNMRNADELCIWLDLASAV